MERPDFFELKNGKKVKLPFSNKEYNQRIDKLRSVMDKNNLDMIILMQIRLDGFQWLMLMQLGMRPIRL